MNTNLFNASDETAALARLHDRLARGAEQRGLLDVAYRIVDTPVGVLLLAATDVGLVRVAFDVQDHDAVLDALARAVSPRILLAPARLDAAARQLDDYFSKRRRTFELPLDLRLATGFRRMVLDHLRRIGYGQRQTYAAVARAVGNPRAVRAVGTACACNPLPIVIGCHRVVRSDGSTGQYAGGAQAKSALLSLEAA
ncbi:methylated-DNA--[protein]-cysteine S-methyltransferase [Mycobacterium heckeshornense]|uniref:methylated-DNA--[protein]-cysteine S-methyltransferase n=1 Tax=Mycobacterium heckeshornense TaxID=110505 RepID=A0A2G8B438_9MYCO|nr:methylated-DNA--[protein]-cysteine S-methyltransferase [Mycobacterium heckeshornense]KMV22386.1 cysteine methyltransferase [Mycobacterium heckeshornense]MCV7034799.1 methylated-DNA--[protein]-cysteine S-methyltransferase [Mycobacterium heckeshornense]PIJ32508.1 methylated-DNA--[protein]-cysteine S-methyltransferase [Mycobacterium heckeshornense]BCO36737.1 methylated-DNA--protein-cysteine methyltransferase [Mycobacterium heckeshornense]BCQ09621.1 methylated-DNA--protein-cysteine methyltransf